MLNVKNLLPEFVVLFSENGYHVICSNYILQSYLHLILLTLS